MSDRIQLRPFPVPKASELATEHEQVSAWVEAAAQQDSGVAYKSFPLKQLPSGQVLLARDAHQSLRTILAALAQVEHWESEAERVRIQATDGRVVGSLHLIPGWNSSWKRRLAAAAVISELLRRKLPWRRQDLLALIKWPVATRTFSRYLLPLSVIVRVVEQNCSENPIDDEVREMLKRFAARLRADLDKPSQRLATTVEQLCHREAEQNRPAPSSARRSPPKPASAGRAGVLTPIKQRLGILPAETAESESTLVGPDQFPLASSSPLRREHEQLNALLTEALVGTNYFRPELSRLATGKRLLKLDARAMGDFVLASAERHLQALMAAPPADHDYAIVHSRYASQGLISALALLPFQLSRPAMFDWLLYVSTQSPQSAVTDDALCTRWLDQLQTELGDSQLAEGERFVLCRLRAALVSGPLLGRTTDNVQRLTVWIGDGAAFCLTPGEVWCDAVNADFAEMSPARRDQWSALFGHAATATSSRPSAKWLRTATALVKELSQKEFCTRLERWLPLVSQGGSSEKLGRFTGDTRGAADTMQDENANCLRGLLWLIPTLPEPDEVVRLVTNVALTAYKKVPGVGPRAVKVGNAAIYALSEIGSIDAVGQLAMLKVRVKFGTAQKEIEKAFNKAAEALGLPRDQIEEMGVPSYGLEAGGTTSEQLGDYRAELTVTGSDAQLTWFDAQGKQLKSVPAKVKSDYSAELRELKQSQKDILGMLPAQRDRIDAVFLGQQSWGIAAWRERYLDHPLIGTIARRLLWCIDGTPALFVDGAPQDIHSQTIQHGKTAEVTLWHPVGRPVEEIVVWRRRLEELRITQPFKQAHREVYLLTDAERRTNTYSNRYAAHVLRQHQFHALCAARGWKNRLRLMVDDSYQPPTKDLPQWGLRAEYWVEGIGDGYGLDTNEAGVYLRLSTDQVRFYRTGAAHHFAHAGGGGYATTAQGPGTDNINEPLPLEQIPPLVFSEIMRDVDLFVGVASVGNDPTWQDGGPEGRYREYWANYSFGELSGTASTRKQVLERLIPRLKIAPQCSVADRFLTVRGQLRTYKIHLGSGNILMEPNDQYLCIVPDSRSSTKENDLFLPFEGDKTLSIILSKAFLLAEDQKIKDPTITRQLRL